MSLGTRKTKTEGSGNVLRRRRTILAWGFALPFAVVFCVFMLIPLLSSMAMSFTDITSKDLRTPFNVNFVGRHRGKGPQRFPARCWPVNLKRRT